MNTELVPLQTRDRRILKELQYIRTYKTIYNTISFNYIDDKLYVDIKTKKGNILRFDIHKNYPFMGPKLQIQTANGSYNYKERLCNMPASIYYFIQNPNDYFKKTNKNLNISKDTLCLCCNSIFCEDNWTPVVMLYQIINEIEDHNKIKQNIAYKLVLNQYCKIKNLTYDIIKPIVDFLL